MEFYSVTPYFLAMALVLGLASTPLFKFADTPPSDVPARVNTIDGLRGLLAFAVFFYHSMMWHEFLVTGAWRHSPSRFYNNLGPAGVSMFFMITGYLFWSQMLKAKGRPDFFKLYVGRLFRIVPLYLVLALIVLGFVGFATHWRLNQSPLAVFAQVMRLLAGGVLSIPDEINAYREELSVLAGVTWTLHYEWLFYASLIVTAFFARTRFGGLLLPLAGLALSALLVRLGVDWLEAALTLLFSLGMIAAAVQKPLTSALERIPQWALSATVIGVVALALTRFDRIYGVWAELLLGVGFLMIVSGTTVFGLLQTRSARRLGDVSYGIYLLHGPLLLLAFSLRGFDAAAAASPAAHWGLVVVAAVALTIVATLAHSLVERPGIQVGRRAVAALGVRAVASEPPLRINQPEAQPQSS